MYTIPECKIEIRLISPDGVVGVYPDYTTFIEEVDYWFIVKHIVTTFKDWPSGYFNYWRLEPRSNYPRYVVRDKFGSVYSNSEIINDKLHFNKDRCASTFLQWQKKKHDFIYRQTPVPYTGSGNRKRGRFGNYYKIPRCAQEKKWNIAHKEYTRGKRRNLPDPWDDMVRSDIRERRNWKRRRKTQWK